MKHREQLRPLSFDEQRALEDLQKLHREIQRARGDREQAEAEFESFVRSFRAPEQPPAPIGPRESRPAPPPVVAREAIPAPAPAATAPAAAPPPRVDPLPQAPAAPPPQRVALSPAAAPPLLPRVDEPPAEVAPPVAAAPVVDESRAVAPAPKDRRVSPALAVGIAAVVVAIAFFAVFGSRSGPETVRDVPAGAAPQPQAEPQPQSAEPAPTPAAATPAAGLNLELITRRTVWVRVTVDGRRAIERELPGGERIPLRAEESIVIRAGDAGAIAVRRGDGAEVRLGEDGIVATRTFSADRTAGAPR